MEKEHRFIVALFAVFFALSLTRQFYNRFFDAIGVPTLGKAVGVLFILGYAFFLFYSAARQLMRIPKVSKMEIPLLLLLAIFLVQIFNPFINPLIGLNGFVSYFITCFSVYIFSSRIIRCDRDLKILFRCLYVYALVNLSYGISTGIFGLPSFELHRVPMNLFEVDGTLRIRAFTLSDQTYFLTLFIIVIWSYFDNRKIFLVLAGLVGIQLAIYTPKNPVFFLVIVSLFAVFVAKRYRISFVILFLLLHISLSYWAMVQTTFSGRESTESWLRLTPYGIPSVIDRYWRWVESLHLIRSNMFGYGLGAASDIATQETIYVGIAPHNEYLRIAIEAGVPATGLILIFAHTILMRVRSIVHQNPSFLMRMIGGFLFGFLVISSYNNHLFGGEEKFFFWLFSGLVASRNQVLVWWGRSPKGVPA